MRNLYLGLQGLAPADMKLLKVFLRFAGRTENHQWSLALEESEDLILRQTARQGDTLPMGIDPVVQAPVAWVLGEGEDGAGVGGFTLQRPLQMEPFAALLRAREEQIETASRRPSALPPQHASERAVPLRAVAVPAPVERVAAPTPAPASASAPAALPASTVVDDPHIAYRLLKWPGTDLMRGQPKFVRMLAFLTHKPLSVRRLMELSGVDDATCLAMLTLLDTRGLLARVDAVVETPPRSGENTADPDAPPVAPNVVALPLRAAPPSASAQSGLFHRLRKRLGLGSES